MALGFNTESKSSGDILPIIKFDAKGGDFIIQDRQQDADGQWGKTESELKTPLKMAIDLENIEVGWLSFSSGAPDFQMVKIGQPMPAKPSDEHKQAFRVRVASKALGLREFSHSAKTVLKEMDSLHNQFMAEKGANAGKVPVVEVTGTKTVKVNTPQGELRFKAPEWKISSWVDGSELFPTKGAATPTAAEDVADDGDDLFI